MCTVEDVSRPEGAHRREMGRFLRTRRKMLSPGDVQINPRRHRRRAGLSREEVAYLAGISADWYGRLEAGIAAAPSFSTLLAVAAALRLNSVETEYLLAFVDGYPARACPPAVATVPDAVRALIASNERVGMIVWDAYMTPLAWNAVADSMFNITPFPTPLERNLVVRMADRHFVEFFGEDYEPVMRRVVGLFRRAFTARGTGFADEVVSIARQYARFCEYWDGYEIAEDMLLGDGPRVRHHPVAGGFACVVADLRPSRCPEMLRIVAPADDASAASFAILRRLGTPSSRETPQAGPTRAEMHQNAVAMPVGVL